MKKILFTFTVNFNMKTIYLLFIITLICHQGAAKKFWHEKVFQISPKSLDPPITSEVSLFKNDILLLDYLILIYILNIKQTTTNTNNIFYDYVKYYGDVMNKSVDKVSKKGFNDLVNIVESDVLPKVRLFNLHETYFMSL